MDVSRLIMELGGPAKLARELGITTQAVSNWSATQRVPAVHELAVWRRATAAGLDWAPPGADGLALVEKGAAA